ncbi:MAG: mechanosensitive ion channel family protein [Pseudomonadota bacterium]
MARLHAVHGCRLGVDWTRARAFSLHTLFALCLVCGCGLARAQSAAALAITSGERGAQDIALPAQLGVEDVDALVAPLTDDQTRQLLLQALHERAVASEPTALDRASEGGLSRVLESLRAGSANAIASAAALSEALPRLRTIVQHAFILLTDLQGWPRMSAGLANLALMVLFGLIAAHLAGRVLRGFFSHASGSETTETVWFRFVALSVRAVPEVGQLLAFIVAGRGVSLLYFDRFDPMRLFLIGWFSALASAGAALLLARLLFAPNAAGLRLPHVLDRTARTVSSWFVSVVFVAAFFALNAGMFLLLAVPPVLVSVWEIVGAGLITGLTLLALRRGQTDADAGSAAAVRTPGGETAFSVSNHIGLVATCVLLLFAVWAGRTFAGESREAAAVVVAGLAFAGAWYARRVILRIRANNTGPGVSARPEGAFAGVPMGLIALGGIALVQAVLVDLVALAATPIGREVTGALLKVLVTLVVAGVIWTVLSRTISRYIEREHARAVEDSGDVSGDGEGGTHIVESRLGTLLPLFRGFALTVIAIITFMIVLSSFGVDIGPLLAGAGVVGIALGFGAQALVKDIISGIFFLIDDAFRVGEYIEFGEYRGEVERISIRSMRLRHHRGAVQTIPFGELLVVVNHNRDWVIYKQEFQVPYEADIEKIRKIVKRIGLALLEDPVHGPNFLAPLKSQGVRRVENGVLVICTKFTCKPREQFLLRRVVYQRVRDALYENGIALAHRRVQIELPESAQPLAEDSRRAVTAAAEAVIEDDTGTANPGVDGR